METTKNTLSRCILYAHTYTNFDFDILKTHVNRVAVLGALLAGRSEFHPDNFAAYKKRTSRPTQKSQHLLTAEVTYTHTALLHTHTHTLTKWQVESNVALEVLAQYFRPMKYGIQDNAALRCKKLDSSWDVRSRNIENLYYSLDAHQKYGRWWCDVGSESSEIFVYLSLCPSNSALDVAAPKKKWNIGAHAGRGRRILCFLCIWNRNMIRTSRNEILDYARSAMIIQTLSRAIAVHSLNSRDCSLTWRAWFGFQPKSICRL